MQIPSFPECNHPIVKSLFHYSDGDLLALFQRHPEEGRYFTAIFCRYSPIVYTLIAHSIKSPVQADYLFALTWRHVLHEMRSLDLRESLEAQGISGEAGSLTLQNWLINMTAACINQVQLPPVESIHYALNAAPPPLWCYLQQALDQIEPPGRVMVVMAQTLHWSETRIAAYLQAEGESIAPADVRQQLHSAYRQLHDLLPQDIRTIYMDGTVPESAREMSNDKVAVE